METWETHAGKLANENGKLLKIIKAQNEEINRLRVALANTYTMMNFYKDRIEGTMKASSIE